MFTLWRGEIQLFVKKKGLFAFLFFSIEGVDDWEIASRLQFDDIIRQQDSQQCSAPPVIMVPSMSAVVAKMMRWHSSIYQNQWYVYVI